jgi:hypothetical protein
MARTSAAASKANDTRKTNAHKGIDFKTGVPAEKMPVIGGTRQPIWVRRIRSLVEGVTEGEGEYDKFYLLGEFVAPGGARQTIKNLAEHVDKLPPYQLNLESVPDGSGGSQLWGAVVAPDK